MDVQIQARKSQFQELGDERVTCSDWISSFIKINETLIIEKQILANILGIIEPILAYEET